MIHAPPQISDFTWHWREWLGRLVAVQDWQTPTLINSWTDAGTPYPPVGYYTDPYGVTRFRGRVTGGTSGTAAFVVQGEAVPAGKRTFACDGGTVEIDGAGNVVVTGISVSLDNIQYRSE